MSSLTPLGINALLGSHSNVLKQTLPFTPTPKIIRKHYSDHESQDHHEEHHYSKKQSRSIALTALTLLAFLFFLHILQQCLHDQVEMTTTPTTVVMQATIQRAKESVQNLGKEGSQNHAKENVQNILKESHRAGESLVAGMEATTPSGSDERQIPPGTSKEGSSLYQYDKVHIPVKMKMVEKHGRIKKL